MKNTKKIEEMQFCADANSRHGYESTKAALLVAFSPFGSLTQVVDGEALADAMINWVAFIPSMLYGGGAERSKLAGELVGLVLSSTTDDHSTLELDDWRVTLRTPTSGTEIRLFKSEYSYNVFVYFGKKGSTSQAADILAAAEKMGVNFRAYEVGAE